MPRSAALVRDHALADLLLAEERLLKAWNDVASPCRDGFWHLESDVYDAAEGLKAAHTACQTPVPPFGPTDISEFEF